MQAPDPDQLILEPADRRRIIINLLRAAERRVIMSLFRCDDSPVLDEIVATARRGVDMKVLVTRHAQGWDKRLGGLVTMLKGAGVDVRQYRGTWTKYHAKYLVADDSTAMIGSLNLTRKCLDETCDFLLVSHQPDLVSGLATLFDFDWNAVEAPLPDLSGRLIVGPNQARSRILELLERAQNRIRIVDHRVTDPEVLLMIARKMQAGVRVLILGRGEAGNRISHGKLTLIDEKVAFFGSVPLSKAGLTLRREVAVVIEDASMVGTLSRYFERMIELNTNRANTPDGTSNDEDDGDDD